MEKSQQSASWQPEWFTPEQINTVVFAFPDMYGRLMGKRLTHDFFIHHVLHSGMHACNYLTAVDLDMNVLSGFKLANWDKGFGDFTIRPDLDSLRQLPWQDRTAIVLGRVFDENGHLVQEIPRQILARQIELLAPKGYTSYIGSELEFLLIDESYREARNKDYCDLRYASDYSIDYHILQPARDEELLGCIRDEMNEAGITVECSKGETGKGQHEINLHYTHAMEMADRHTIYKTGAKDIASQYGKAISFMAKPTITDAGNGFHIHISLWDRDGQTNLFFDPNSGSPSRLFRQFLGGLLKYSKELTYFFAPTINSYKRFQAGSWAPTAIVCGRDNRTCGFRVVGEGQSLRIENRMPGADANPYLAFAATLAAGIRGLEEDLEAEVAYKGNAYEDNCLPRLPLSLEEATELLYNSTVARTSFGNEVVDFYVHTARLEVAAFRNTVTDWERRRYFEQI